MKSKYLKFKARETGRNNIMKQLLVIAEKPDMARSIAAAISQYPEEKKGYIETPEGITVTWAIGHLLELPMPEDLDESYKNWEVSFPSLPIIPGSFTLKPIPEKKRQLSSIKSLAQKSAGIVNACDAGSEGQLIFTYISMYLGLTKKPTKRLWTSSLQPEAIRKAFREMKDNKEYQSLTAAAISRSHADWIIGLNATRAFTVKAGNLINVGRVITPTVALVADVHQKRSNFKKQIYYEVEAQFEQKGILYKGKWDGEPIYNFANAQDFSHRLISKPAKINQVEEEVHKQPAPLLMNLSDLISEANNQFGYKGKETQKIAQSLYEKHKCISYPRTSSRAVTKDEIKLMQKSYETLKNEKRYEEFFMGADHEFVSVENKRVCNPEKVTDHHALLPEPVVPQNLNEKEGNIYDIIIKRFALQFFAPAKKKITKIETVVQEEIFTSKYEEYLQMGWKRNIKDADEQPGGGQPPNLNQELSVQCNDSIPLEKETTPPSLFTDGSLISAMANIGNRIKDEKLRKILKDKGIGTESTRADTIAKMEREKLISYKGKSLEITKKGLYVINALRSTNVKTLTSPEYTAMWELKLSLIQEKRYSPKEFMKEVNQFAEVIVKEASALDIMVDDLEEVLGDCPNCKHKVKEGNKNYYCTNKECDFFFWKTQYRKNLTSKMAALLLLKGKTNKLTFKNGEGRSYKAILVLPGEVKQGKLGLEFK
jgi:DNA topoisomerase III